MPKVRIERAREERNAALVEAMLLAAASDGGVSRVELRTVLRRIVERPEFSGMKSAAIGALVERSADHLASIPDLKHAVASLRDRLPSHAERLLAFGLAASIAFADHRATRAELGLLKTFQAALGISEAEVVQIVDVVERGGSLGEALGERPERLYAEVMVLMSAADGTLREAEARTMVESLAGDPSFAGVSADRAEQYVADAVVALSQSNLADRLEVLARGLSSHPQRLRAYELALRIARATGSASPAEKRVLGLLQATFGLADDEIERLEGH